MNLKETIENIRPLDEGAMKVASARWDSIAKPLHSLGKLEKLVIQIAGITGSPQIDLGKKAVVPMCADNGVVAEGVTQTGQEVTAIVAENFLRGETTACVMSRCCGADVVPYDMGMVTDTKVTTRYKVRPGTANLAVEPAMTREQALMAVEGGIAIARELAEQGYRILATGEMGIGNTTTSSAVACVLTGREVEAMTGRGAGLSTEGLARKCAVIRKAIAMHQPDPEDPLDVLAKVGGLDIAALTGLYLGAAALRLPVVMDGFISCVAALAAAKLCPECRDYMLPAHVSKEPASVWVLQELGKDPILHADMCLGEGTGAAALFPLLDMAVQVYSSMSTFDEIEVDQYQEFSL